MASSLKLVSWWHCKDFAAFGGGCKEDDFEYIHIVTLYTQCAKLLFHLNGLEVSRFVRISGIDHIFAGGLLNYRGDMNIFHK